ncbi:MAG: hypothetical protein E7053_08695 [Lentisphaerae bacterium]|nr:hypothetical protein [Lentisphaerota bacterium]
MAYLLKDLLLNAAKLPPDWSANPAAIAAEALHLAPEKISGCEILSASIDSRKGNPKVLLSLRVDSSFLPPTAPEEFAAFTPVAPEIPEKTTLTAPLIVGTGPAGIFAALVLARAGCAPVIIDRGSPVDERVKNYQTFLHTRQLDPESNLLIGEGGAGTFSDGKLYTGTKDFRASWVKKILVECGAPQEILWQKRAHIGSDFLALTAKNLRKKIESLGGRFIFNTEITGLVIKNGVCSGVKCASGEVLTAPKVLLAPGLGGRKLIRNILGQVQWMLKPFQIGCRIEHPQKIVDLAMYHIPRPAALGAAEYHLVSRKYPRHSASFCMCPGGEVVNATAWENRSISNGMSCFARNTEFANSCLISTFSPDEYGSLDNVDALMEKIETQTFAAGGGDYSLPAQDASAFLRKESGLKNRRTSAQIGIIPGRIDQLVPNELFNALSSAVKDLDRHIPGFLRQGKFIGVESCVSSPVRIVRDRETLRTSIADLYCAGEGCGLAGGIVSAACDGIACALKMME